MKSVFSGIFKKTTLVSQSLWFLLGGCSKVWEQQWQNFSHRTWLYDFLAPQVQWHCSVIVNFLLVYTLGSSYKY